MSAESLEELRKWYDEHKATPECRLALKHRHAMDPAVAAELKARAPGDTDEEKELGLVFALTQIAEKLDAVQMLMRGISAVDLKQVDYEEGQLAELQKTVADLKAKNQELESKLAEEESARVPVGHVDVAPEPISEERLPLDEDISVETLVTKRK